jgi:hypothetical protein
LWIYYIVVGYYRIKKVSKETAIKPAERLLEGDEESAGFTGAYQFRNNKKKKQLIELTIALPAAKKFKIQKKNSNHCSHFMIVIVIVM